ncbi:MAG: O-antigen ligase family protein [Actinobacteria bacterium]|jgi:O-antigen ligase|nr:O-antigen ligase family protein [Actinomycetota bacterium]
MASAVTSTLNLFRVRAVYSWIAFATPPISIFGHALAPGQAVYKGQDLGVWAALVCTLAAALAWLPYARTPRLPALPTAFLVTVAVAWAVEVARFQADGSLFNVTAFCVPVIVILLVTKPPSAADIVGAGLALMYSLALVAIVSIPLGALGWMPNGFDASDSALCRTPIICDLTGGLDRWGGPFGSVNYSAPIGGLLIVFGAAQRRRHAWFLIATGCGILVLSQGRSALFALLIGLTVLLLWGARVTASRHAAAIRAAALSALGVGFMLYLVFIDPTLNGRTGIWGDFLALWRSAPLVGVGDSGIRAYVESRAGVAGLVTVDHAHSVFLDMLVRWGVPLAALTLVIYAVAVTVAIRGLKAVGPGPLAVASFVIAAGFVETIYSWVYWTVYLAALTWAVIRAAPHERQAT